MMWKQRKCLFPRSHKPQQNMHGKNSLSCDVIQSIHVSDKAALPCNVAAKLEDIPDLKFHFVSRADTLRNLKRNTGLQDCHSELTVSKSHSLLYITPVS